MLVLQEISIIVIVIIIIIIVVVIKLTQRTDQSNFPRGSQRRRGSGRL